MKLQGLLQYLKLNSPFYQKLFANHNINIEAFQSLSDLSKIPFTTKTDLQNFNEDFICVPRNKIIDYVTTSGTLGSPVTFAMTEKDLQRLAYNEYLSFQKLGVTGEDVFQLMLTLDKRFMAGIAYFEGLRKIGAGIIRVGSGSPGLQLDSILRFKPTGVVVVPSFMVKLGEFIIQQGLNPKELGIQKALCIGEPIRDIHFNLNILGRKIKELWNIELYSTYASTEMATAFTECEAGKGAHLHTELMIVELVDEEGNQVKPGEIGEIVATTLGMEAMPLLRFRTGDLATYYDEPCSCGRTSLRLSPIVGRQQQMIKFKGTSLYPPSIFEVLNGVSDIDIYIVELTTNEIGMDEVTILLHTKDASEDFFESLKELFRTQIRVVPNFKTLPVKELMTMKFPPMSRKPVKLIDRRRSIY